MLMKLPGETGSGVRGDSAVHAGQPEQSDWLDRRAQRRRTLRHIGGLQLSENEAGRRSAADRGANRSERAAFRTVDAVESARLARAPRQPAGDSDRARAVVCGADLPAGGAEPDAGVASRRARAAGSARLRTDVRVGDGGALWRSGLVDERRAVPVEQARRPASAASPQPARISTRSSRKPPKTLPTTSA